MKKYILQKIALFIWIWTLFLLIPYWVDFLYGPSFAGFIWIDAHPNGEASQLELAIAMYTYAIGVSSMLIASIGVVLFSERRKEIGIKIVIADLLAVLVSQFLNFIFHR